MLKVDAKMLATMERQHPGIREAIRALEQQVLPACARCRSANTAKVHCGVVGRTIYLAAATTKFKLIPNAPKPGAYFCNDCGEFFGWDVH
jgi:hypothetical protein